MFYHMIRYELAWVILSFVEWWVHSRKVHSICWSFSFCVPIVLLASNVQYVNGLPWVLTSTFARQIPHTTKPELSIVCLSIQKGLFNQIIHFQNSVIMEYVLSFKKRRRRRRKKKEEGDKNPYLLEKELQNKKFKIKKETNPYQTFSKCESIFALSFEYFTFHKIGILSNLLRTTLRLGSNCKQGMLHSYYAKLHISSLEYEEDGQNFPTIIHLEELESTIGESWTTFKKYYKIFQDRKNMKQEIFHESCSVSQPPKVKEEMRVSPIY